MNTPKHNLFVTVIRWSARAASLASVVLLAMFLFGPEERAIPTMTEAVALAFFPFGVAAGMLVGWWREGLGGAITLASLSAFYLYMIALGGHAPHGPYFLLFAAPGLAYLVCWALDRAHTPRPAAA